MQKIWHVHLYITVQGKTCISFFNQWRNFPELICLCLSNVKLTFFLWMRVYVCVRVFFFFYSTLRLIFLRWKNSILDWRKNPINKFNEKLITFFIYWKFYDVSDETGSFGKITIFHPINIPHSVFHHQLFFSRSERGRERGGLFLNQRLVFNLLLYFFKFFHWEIGEEECKWECKRG